MGVEGGEIVPASKDNHDAIKQGKLRSLGPSDIALAMAMQLDGSLKCIHPFALQWKAAAQHAVRIYVSC